MSIGHLTTVVALMAAWCVALGRAKTYDRCELARDLLHKHRLPANQISQCTDFPLFIFRSPTDFPYRFFPSGVCLVRWESEFNTSAIGSLNADGSLDHGLFQISDKYWCYGPGPGEACGLPCDGNFRKS